MLRSIAYAVAVTVLTITHSSAAIICALFGVRSKTGGVYDRLPWHWGKTLLRVTGIKVDTVGFENVPCGSPVVYVSNHQSFFDIIALAATLPFSFRFVAKRELAKIPIFGQGIRAAGHIYIDRQRQQKAFASYEKAAESIKKGLSALVFAEGTRSRTGDLLPFKKGPFVLAIAAQVPIIPVYCAKTFDILPKGSIRIRPHPIALYFGEPIPTKGLDYEARNELLQRARSVIEGFAATAKGESALPVA